MHKGSHQRPAVVAARERLQRERQKLKRQHQAGSPGIQVCARLTDLLDSVLLDLYHAALADVGDSSLESNIALVPHGGYGRRDVAPYSDVDLMLLYRSGHQQNVAPLARRLTEQLYDCGLQLGFSLRTPAEACQLALKDTTIFTSLVEARYLGGSVRLFTGFMSRFRRNARRRSQTLITRIEQARRQEQIQYGETVYLLRPNVKRTPGGLRDIQMLRWVGFARYGEAEPQSLERMGGLLKSDSRKLRNAHEFLLRLRNELHFHAGRSLDVLAKDEQLRLAGLYGYLGEDGVLPVEQFMRDYFEHTSEVQYIVAHFVATARKRPGTLALLGSLFSRQAEGDFRVGPVHISATRKGLRKLHGDLAQVLRLMDLANHCQKRIDHPTWMTIRQAMIDQPTLQRSPEAVNRFLSLLSQPGRLADLLRRLHELRVLEKIIPAMRHARSLLQFNEYHKYTVDEHSIRAVQCATDFRSDPGPVGRAYRGIKQKATLHLALLIHDLGKGFAEDHSEVGLRLAEETAQQLNLPNQEAEILKFLVHKHLLMAHLAFRHDLSDESVIVRFAVEIGRPDLLQMLYVLTCADVAAVGPGVLTSWKLDLLTELYHRTRECLASDSPASYSSQHVRTRRQALRTLVGDSEDPWWWDRHIRDLPRRYLEVGEPQQIVDELERLRRLSETDVVAWGRYVPDRKAVEYTIGAHEEIIPGVFHRLTGALSSKGLQILSAEIHTLADNLILDRFYVHDLDFNEEPPQQRMDEVCRALVQSLKEPSDQPPTFRQLWNAGAQESGAELNPLPSQVQFDNSTADKFTIIAVFAYDRLGLLYSIARTLFQLQLSVHVAKIATHLDQVVDVFYVTHRDGGKIYDEQRMHEIRTALLEAIHHIPVP